VWLSSTTQSVVPSPSPSPSPSPAAPASVLRALEPVASAHARFEAAYAEGVSGTPGFQAWAETFYRRPHPELLPGALVDILRTPGLGVGPSSLPVATFLAGILRVVCKDPKDVAEAVELMLAAMEREGVGATRSTPPPPPGMAAEAGEKLDTFLRALWLANTPACDAYLGTASGEWLHSVAAAAAASPSPPSSSLPPPPKPTQEHIRALAQSLLPPPEHRNRLHITQWPIPILTLASFERHLRACPFPLYGCTRHFFMHTHALHTFAKDPALASRVQLMSPLLAQALTTSLVDALWAAFYLSGRPEPVLRVLDVGTAYVDFLDEYGDEYVREWPKEAPAGLADDPLGLMAFEASRYALHSFLSHCETHTAVSDIAARQLAHLYEQVMTRDPLGIHLQGVAGGMAAHGDDPNVVLTAFGRKRLDLLQLLLPAMARAGEEAARAGVGSGAYPGSFRALRSPEENASAAALVAGGAADAELLALAASGARAGDVPALLLGGEGVGGGEHHNAPATASEPVAVAGEGAAGTVAVAAASFADAPDFMRKRRGVRR
jgi:hypothetical protein